MTAAFGAAVRSNTALDDKYIMLFACLSRFYGIMFVITNTCHQIRAARVCQSVCMCHSVYAICEIFHQLRTSTVFWQTYLRVCVQFLPVTAYTKRNRSSFVSDTCPYSLQQTHDLSTCLKAIEKKKATQWFLL